MRVKLLTLTGIRGVGKTTVASGVLDFLGPKGISAQSTTTRPRRGDELPGEFKHVSREVFQRMRAQGDFLWTTQVPGRNSETGEDEIFEYGTEKDVVRSIITSDKVGVMYNTPETIPILKRYIRQNYSHLPQPVVLSIYLFANERTVARRLFRRPDMLKLEGKERLNKIKKTLEEHASWLAYAQGCGEFDLFLPNELDGPSGISDVLEKLERFIKRLNGVA